MFSYIRFDIITSCNRMTHIDLGYTNRHVASLRAGSTLIIYWAGQVVVGNVGDSSVSSYRLHAFETQHLSYVPMAEAVADATPICYVCGIDRGQPSASD